MKNNNFVKDFNEFINESKIHSHVEMTDETPDWSTFKDAMDSADKDSPDMEDVAKYLYKDCRCKPEDLLFKGHLKSGSKLRTQMIDSPSGYPGAITISKYEEDGVTYYILHGYDNDFVFAKK